ncbi:hypothetical protein [Kingella oralis]|uniref:hypothetical protein n=1 Tax=Kingella oralis TaxID=505 RepID=UPI002D7E6ADC|nr:hypothetical protein [Kingella oralis]
MNKMPFILAALLAACSQEPQSSNSTTTSDVAAPTIAASTPVPTRVMALTYSDYQKVANKLLKVEKTDLTIPEHIHPTPNPKGSKNMLHDLAEGLLLSVETDTQDQISEVRIVWQPEKNPQQSKKLSSAAAALLAATLPDDKSMIKDVKAQMNMAVESNQVREFARFQVSFKIASTNLPSVVLTAKPE